MPRTGSRRWTRGEAIKALSLYGVLPFGRFHKANPDVIALAGDLGRTAGKKLLRHRARFGREPGGPRVIVCPP